MKRTFFVIALCLGVLMGFAQEEKSAIDLKNEGNEALRAKNFKGALELFEKSLAKWGDEAKDTAMIYNIAYCAYNTEDFAKAVKYFDESINNKYKVGTAYLFKANSFKKAGNDQGYVETLIAGLAAIPGDAKMKDMLAKSYLKEGNNFYKAGATILQKAAADVTANKYKTTDEAYKKAVADAKEEFKKALPLFVKALEVSPEDATAKQLKAACEQNIK